MIDADGLAADFRRLAAGALDELGAQVVVSCRPDPPAGRLFLVEATVETPVGRVRLEFGGRELQVRSSIHPVGRPWPLDVLFYLRALGRDPAAVEDSAWVHSTDRLARILQCHSEAIRVCLDLLAVDPVGLWRRADAERVTALAEGERMIKRMEQKALDQPRNRTEDTNS